ncbi:hypothetical protein ACQPXS_40155 [Streptomyces sp. CA-142005]|uniref:hypothetical protein n=1 Tax=Streptomyces sp. CA-142005 TaxID=3240052 RepID=UPI003D91159D
MPLGTGRQVTGALTLVRTDPARPFDTGDLDVASNIGRRVGPVIDNARRFGRRREVAEAMHATFFLHCPSTAGSSWPPGTSPLRPDRRSVATGTARSR